MKKLLLILFLLSSIYSFSQNDTSKYFNSVDYGWRYKRIKIDSALLLPKDTIRNKLGLSTVNGKLLIGDGTKWSNVSSASTGTVTSVALTTPTGLTPTGSPITTSGTLGITYTSGYSIPTTASQSLWDAAYTNRIVTATYPFILGSNNISGDTGRGLNQLATGGDLNKVKDSLAAIIATKGVGSVTSIATSNATGITGGTITSTGTLAIDTNLISTRLWRQKGVDSLNNIIATKGTVTSVGTTNGLGITSSVATATTIPNITIAVDTSNASILSRQRAAATYTAGAIDSIRLVNTGVIFTTPAAYSKAGTTGVITQTLANQSAYKALWNNTSGSAAPAFNYLDSNAFNNKFGTYVQAAQTPSSTYTAGRGTTLTGGAFGLDTTKNYTFTGVDTFQTKLLTPKIIGGTGIGSTLTFQTTTGVGGSGADFIWLAQNNGSVEQMRLQNSGTLNNNSIQSYTGGDLTLKSSSGQSVYFYPNATYLGGFNGTSLIVSNGASTAGKIVVGKNTNGDFASACAEFTSTTRGILPNRWTTTQMNAISSPATGLMGYNTDDKMLMNYDGSNFKSTGVLSGSFSGTGTATTTFTVTFGGTQPNSTYKVNVTPTNALSAALFYVTNKTTTTFDVMYLAGLTGGVAFDYSLTQ